MSRWARSYYAILILFAVGSGEAIGQGHFIYTPCCASAPPSPIYIPPPVPHLVPPPPNYNIIQSRPVIPSAPHNTSPPAREAPPLEEKRSSADCDEIRLNKFVDYVCNTSRKCNGEDSVTELTEKIERVSDCIDAIVHVTNACFNGVFNSGHLIKYQNRKTQKKNCMEFLAAKSNQK